MTAPSFLAKQLDLSFVRGPLGIPVSKFWPLFSEPKISPPIYVGYLPTRDLTFPETDLGNVIETVGIAGANIAANAIIDKRKAALSARAKEFGRHLIRLRK